MLKSMGHSNSEAVYKKSTVTMGGQNKVIYRLCNCTISGDLERPGWRVNGKIIRSVLCSIVLNNILLCTVQCAHMNRHNSSLEWILSQWAHFTVVRFIFVYLYICIYVFCVYYRILYVLIL